MSRTHALLLCVAVACFPAAALAVPDVTDIPEDLLYLEKAIDQAAQSLDAAEREVGSILTDLGDSDITKEKIGLAIQSVNVKIRNLRESMRGLSRDEMAQVNEQINYLNSRVVLLNQLGGVYGKVLGAQANLARDCREAASMYMFLSQQLRDAIVKNVNDEANPQRVKRVVLFYGLAAERFRKAREISESRVDYEEQVLQNDNHGGLQSGQELWDSASKHLHIVGLRGGFAGDVFQETNVIKALLDFGDKNSEQLENHDAYKQHLDDLASKISKNDEIIQAHFKQAKDDFHAAGEGFSLDAKTQSNPAVAADLYRRAEDSYRMAADTHRKIKK